MDAVCNLKIIDSHVSFTFTGTVKEAAELRKRIIIEVYSDLIGSVTFLVNKSSENMEYLTSRLGLLVIKQVDATTTVTGILKGKGPLMLTTDHLEGIESVYKMPIVYLDEGEELSCTLHVSRGCGSDHQRYSPVANITFKEVGKNIQFDMDLIGLLTWEEIVKQLI